MQAITDLREIEAHNLSVQAVEDSICLRLHVLYVGHIICPFIFPALCFTSLKGHCTTPRNIWNGIVFQHNQESGCI
jgi:hypothetical protein